jgi:dUTP pyrophosphatase
LKLLIKKLHENAVIPQYAHESDAGLDLCSCVEAKLPPGEFKLIPTGIAIGLPPLTQAEIRPRSGLAVNSGITVLNSPGTVDSGYTGEIKVILINHSKQAFKIVPGMKIAQMVICPVIKVQTVTADILPCTDRGEGGFGSTGTVSGESRQLWQL